MKKLAASFVLLFLALSLFSGLQFVCSVSANFLPASVPEHSIEITEDGDVTGTDLIQRGGNVYTFTGDVDGSIVVACDDVIIDGAGYTLQGNGKLTGVWLQERYNVEIKNLHIKNFHSGILVTFGSSMDSYTNVTISGNTIKDNGCGIKFSMFIRGNNVLDNTIANNTYGVYIIYSSNNVFRNNRINQNKYNFWVTSELSSQMTEFVNDVDDSNTVDGKPIIYWVNEHDKAVPSDAGYVALIGCTNITVQGLVLANNSQGVLLVATDDSLIASNYIGGNFVGIAFQGSYGHCYNNVISRNNITENAEDGIYSWGAPSTNVTENSITNNQGAALHFYESSNAYIVGNSITGNIEINDSANSTVEQNDAEIPEDEIPDKIPEFPQWTPLLVMVVVMAVAIIYRQDIQKTMQERRQT